MVSIKSYVRQTAYVSCQISESSSIHLYILSDIINCDFVDHVLPLVRYSIYLWCTDHSLSKDRENETSYFSLVDYN